MQDDQRIILLISLKLNGEATPEELIELETYIENNPALAERIENISNVWNNLKVPSTGLAEVSFEKHLLRLNNDVFDSEPLPETTSETHKSGLIRTLWQKKHIRKLWGAAAAVTILFLLLFRPVENTGIKPINNTVSTKAGDKANITLPDGTKVWLNGDSRITYAEDIKNRIREVHLTGEAFFEVARDKTKPFIIHTRMINLKVLGTAFNVRSYDYEKETETALVHGSVEVTLRNSPDQKILLKPGEKLLVKNIPVNPSPDHKNQVPDDDTHIAVLTNMRYYGTDSSNIETSWTKSQLVFTDEPLDKIALNLERWFNVHIAIVNESLKKQKYTATLEEDDKLEDFLEALKLADGFHYSIKNKEVVISR